MSAAMRGKPSNRKGKTLSPETRAKISTAHMGKSLSEETRAKIGAAGKGRNPPNKGVPLSEETRAKIGAAKLGKTHTPEAKAKIGAVSKGKITVLNIETGTVSNIPTELYHSRRDIYFHNSSKVFKEWKRQRQ